VGSLCAHSLAAWAGVSQQRPQQCHRYLSPLGSAPLREETAARRLSSRILTFEDVFLHPSFNERPSREIALL